MSSCPAKVRSTSSHRCPGHPRLWDYAMPSLRGAKRRAIQRSRRKTGLLRRFALAMTDRSRLEVTESKTWMAGTSPAMTSVERQARPNRLFSISRRILRLMVLLVMRRIVPPPAVALHLLGGGDETVGDFAEIGVGVVQAEDQPAGADPAQRQAFGAQVVLKHPVVTRRFGILHHPDRRDVADAHRKIRARSACR